jgi:DNA-binding CsgD family transcriptional regulator
VTRLHVESGAILAIALTPAEVRLLELLPTHLTLAQIAAHMFISRNTAKSQVAAIYRKLAVASRDEAVRRARETGLLPAQAKPHAEPGRGDHQARVLAFPSRAVPEQAERAPEASTPPQSPQVAAQIPGSTVQPDSFIASDGSVASPDVDLVARSRAARDQAHEISVRALQACQMSLRIWTAHERPLPGSSDV